MSLVLHCGYYQQNSNFPFQLFIYYLSIFIFFFGWRLSPSLRVMRKLVRMLKKGFSVEAFVSILAEILIKMKPSYHPQLFTGSSMCITSVYICAHSTWCVFVCRAMLSYESVYHNRVNQGHYSSEVMSECLILVQQINVPDRLTTEHYHIYIQIYIYIYLRFGNFGPKNSVKLKLVNGAIVR